MVFEQFLEMIDLAFTMAPLLFLMVLIGMAFKIFGSFSSGKMFEGEIGGNGRG